MGVATAGAGKIHVTDMDNIETSNLNRQFLFRTADIGLLKSETAAREVKLMNTALRINAGVCRHLFHLFFITSMQLLFGTYMLYMYNSPFV
jgi:molybdopterin/thiamine biosynthesis adenylyltransferase